MSSSCTYAGKTIVDSWNATRGQAKRPMIGLSLAHNPETLEADHVAVVDVGRRSGALVYASAKREEGIRKRGGDMNADVCMY